MTSTGVTINGNLLPWSFVRRVWKKCGGDWEQTIDCFWKARNATGPAGIQKYIMAGFKSRGGGVPYMLQPSKEKQQPGGIAKLWKWWNSLYLVKTISVPIAPDKKPDAAVRDANVSSMKEIFLEVFGGMP